ncbi:hypothetical protein [Acholeplasma hippikon]|uniref:Sugar-phosphate nucleotidyltransferase n=1 Tax=Acholeplasma hippikon TaxID=264636 RepID=A0A449BJY6_9MOLU|nr:hypothetical protein [Acholeplasma hippikon]VEU82758.1 Uncharacterised protein [Acholeplasma hippikon]
MNQLIPITYEENCLIDKNHVATPRKVVEQIYNLIGISDFKSVWLPFNNYDSEFKYKAEELNIKYKATHIFDDLGNDFFITNPPDNCDLMISNPPFEQQNEIIKRSFDLIDKGQIKSFALLLPLSTLETKYRANLYEKYKDKISIIIFKDRIKFLGKTTAFNKACCWVCYNIEKLPPLSWV